MMRDFIGVINQGTTWSGVVTWTDLNDDPIDLTEGYAAEVRFGVPYGASIVTLSEDSGLELGSDGTIRMVLTPTQTAALGGYFEVGVDVDVTDDTGSITPLARFVAQVDDRVGGEG